VKWESNSGERVEDDGGRSCLAGAGTGTERMATHAPQGEEAN